MRAAVYLLLVASCAMAKQTLPNGYVPLGFIAHGSAPGMKIDDLGPALRTYRISLRKGDEIMAALVDFAREEHISEAHFSGIGAIDSGILGWYDPAKHEDRKITIASEAEIVSLIGDISKGRDGEPRVHAHISVAFDDGSLKGGHLFEGRISLVGQIYVTAGSMPAPPLKPGSDSSGS